MRIIKRLTGWSVSLLIIAVVLATVGCEKNVALEKFSSKAGRFSLMAPGNMEKESRTIQTKVGPVELISYTVSKRNYSYIVSFSDYPQEVVDQSDPDKMLLGARNGLLKSIQGKLISEDKIAYENDPGVEIHFTAKNGIGEGHMVLVLSGKRLYQVGAIGRKDSFPAEAVKQYIESFEIW